MLLLILHELWSIIDDSGFVVSSVVSSHPALLAFHMLAGNLDRAPEEFFYERFEAGGGSKPAVYAIGIHASLIDKLSNEDALRETPVEDIMPLVV